MTDKFNINALFLGSKAENAEIFEKLLLEAFRDHIFWRRNFHPEDPLTLSQTDRRAEGYEATVDNMQSKFYELLSKLKQSVPFHSPRYLGHMLSDILMPGMLGYFATMLYNPNNVCYEASPVTSKLEIEVGQDLASMMGYDPGKSWAHLTSGGTVANIEALWVIRNSKYFPLIAADLLKKYNKDLEITLANGQKVDLKEIQTDFELMSFSPKTISGFANKFFDLDWGVDIQNEVYKHHRNISHCGMKDVPIGKILVPASKHYSWPKAAEILGIGRANIEAVKVDSNFRVDAEDLKSKLVKLYEQKIPVLAVVGILGSTECASIDPIDKIVDIRDWYEKEYNSSFYIHVDAAYGGYPRSLFINEDNSCRDLKDMQADFKDSKHLKWPYVEVYNAYKAMPRVDSVTIDPHKLGYILYPAGAVVFKDKSVKPATLVKAPYINNTTKSDNDDLYIGSYILEGSKPGAAAAACWLAHRIVPLNKEGYGKILSDPIQNAHILYDILKSKNPISVDTKDGEVLVNVELLNDPDLDILLYVFNIQGNTSLEKMNRFNELILEEFSIDTQKPIGAHEFVVSSTDFEYDIYSDSVNPALEKLGINLKDWTDDVKSLKILRSSVVSPLVNKQDLKDFYWNNFAKAIDKAIVKIVNKKEL